MAQNTIAQQAIIDKLREGVKSSNPDFDEDTVDYVMQRADMLATTGKFKTAKEAVDAALGLVKSKFDAYANRRNAVPPLPAGARAETAPPAAPAPVQKDEALPSASDELKTRQEGQLKKIL